MRDKTKQRRNLILIWMERTKMNGKKIPPDKQDELILRAEPFLSGKKTPTTNADEFYTLL